MRKYLSLFLLITVFVPLIIQAQTVEMENDLPCGRGNSLINLIDRIIDFVFLFVFLGIAPIMIIIATYYFITAAGDSKKINTAKKMILWALIALLIVFCAKALISLFRVC